MHVLVTGGAGYIGSTVTERLLGRGHRVTVLDRFFFGDTLADLTEDRNLKAVRGDIRWVEPAFFDGVDAVLDLAALSNDPAGDLDPEKTMEINFRGRARVARLAKGAGVSRYVLAASCSTYGFQDDVVTEENRVNPLTTYAKANGLAEEAAMELNDESFAVTSLRQATVHGLSRRMRFDLVVNAMTLALHQKGSLKIMRDGSQWRPLLHVRDAAEAFVRVVEAEPDKVAGEVFHAGSDENNWQILALAEALCEALGYEPDFEWYGDPDHRSYRVSFAKIRDRLEFHARRSPIDGAKEIHEALEAGRVTDGPTTRTVEWYKRLLSGDVDASDVVMNDVVL